MKREIKKTNANNWRCLFRVFVAIALIALFAYGNMSVPLAVAGGSVANHNMSLAVDETLSVTASFSETKVVTPDESIEIVLSRKLSKDERIGVLIGTMDVTELFKVNETRLSYDAKLFPLSLGKSPVVVYLIQSSGEWKEIAHLVLSVVKEKPIEEPKSEETKTETKVEEKTETANSESKEETKAETQSGETQNTTDANNSSASTEATPQPTPEVRIFGFEKMDFVPSFTFGIKSQPFQSNFPADTRPAERATFTDFTLQGSIRNEVQRGIFNAQTQFDFAGSSVQGEALRFGTLGDKAPHIDLGSYLMQIKIGKANLQLGHTSFGGNRHIISSFSSRGITLSVPITKWMDFSAGALNGTSVVGFPNFLGLGKLRHQLQGATIGFEFMPKRPGAMRLEVTGMNGYVQPLSGFNEGRVNDAERSKGLGARFIASDASGRFKIEAGLAVSRFQNPQDTLLDPDGNAVPVPPISRTSHYVETSFQVLRDVSLTKTKKVNLNFSFKHELVNPLFRSLGASTSADKTQQEFSVDGSIGEISIQAGHSRFNDNIKNIPSILKSLTRANRFSIGVPVASLFGDPSKPSPFLPRLSYSYDRTHQFGAGIPVNGGFDIDPSTIPDQFGTNQSFSADWQFAKFNIGYKWNNSFTDNRQQGRELADQRSLVNGISVGFNPVGFLSFNVGLNFESSLNVETGQINRTKSLNAGVTWQPFKGAQFAANLSNTLAGDALRTNNSRNTNFDAQFSYNFSREKSKFKKFGVQAFVRYADTFARSRDFLFDVNNLNRTHIINAGLTINIF